MAGKKDLDALLTEAERAKCPGIAHQVPEEVETLLAKAREAVREGRKISAAALGDVIKREFGVELLTRRLGDFINGRGCQCYDR